jgi:hypothetical protein
LFALFYQSTIPVAKRLAWTAQQKLFAIELKRKSPDKKLDDIIVAIKANYDRDFSASTLHAWLKPENAAKSEQLVNARATTLAVSRYNGKVGLKSKKSLYSELSIQRISGYNEFCGGVLPLPYIESYYYLYIKCRYGQQARR